MAAKEATIFIVDVGESMGEKRHGRTVSDLDWALEYVWDKISAIVATERKTLHVGVIGLRTDDTLNELDSEDAYQHISVLKGLGQALMSDIRRLKEQLVPNSTNSGDAISALVVAIQMITAFCKALKYEKRIFLVTNGRGAMDATDVDHIVEKLAEDKIELTVLGVDFDDAEFGFKEEDKEANKEGNEAALRKLCEDCGGVFGTMSEAIEALSIPRLKVTRPVPSFKGLMTLGNPADYDSAMAIDVERYPRVMIQRPPTASNYVHRQDMASSMSTQDPVKQDLAAVKNARTYQVIDEEAPGGKKDVEQEDLAKGYSYGSTAVPISESDRNVTTFETQPGLDIVGFVAQEQYERYLDMSRSMVIIAQRTNDLANMAFSSFVHALFETSSYAVARLVPKENKPPTLVLLAPHIDIEPDQEVLFEVELPFAEDLRSYRFPSLDRVVTVSGKELPQHRNLPSPALMDAMSAYVDALDLTVLGANGDDGKPTDYLTIDDAFSPVLHRVQQCIRHRAVHPSLPIPPIPEILTKFSRPPPAAAQAAEPLLRAILDAADLKKVPPKTRSRRGFRGKGSDGSGPPKPLSGLDVNALLSSSREAGQRTGKISADNAIPEFKQLLDTATSVADYEEAFAQIGGIVKDFIRHSMGESGYGRAIETLRVMREECADAEMAGCWNEYMKGLKKEVLGEELGGDRREMWFLVRRNRLGLLGRKESKESAVEEEEAQEFLSFK